MSVKVISINPPHATIKVDGVEMTGEYLSDYRASDGYRGRAVRVGSRYYRLDHEPDAETLTEMRQAFGDERH
ncbi:MAG: hypothetical protein HWN51_06575 [Desulfobacterales bacterium]|nr:hypothetical protein [Desulfobacterales bacterium]